MNSRRARKKGSKKGRNPAPVYGTYRGLVKALENPKYEFRTLQNAAREARVSDERARQMIAEHADDLVVLYRKGESGQKLVTTRRHYRKKSSWREKFLGAFVNRVY